MKKLCLILLLCLPAVAVRAEERAEYIKIECHKMLGILDVSFNHVSGSALERRFIHNPEYVMYQDEETDVLAIDKSVLFQHRKNEVAGEKDVDRVYRYRCALIGAPDNTSYDVLISANPTVTDEKEGLGSYDVSIVESKTNSQTGALQERRLVDHIRLGYGAEVDRIIMTGDLDFDNLTFHFEKINNIADIVQGYMGTEGVITADVLSKEKAHKESSKESGRHYQELPL